jgi:hypothetical protein
MALHRTDKRVSDRALIRCGVVFGALALSCAAYAAGAFDGTYAGMARLTSGNNGTVCKDFSVSINITDSHLSYAHGTRAVVNTDVAADGSFDGSAMLQGVARGMPATVELKGKVGGGNLQAIASSANCAYQLALTKH